MSPAPGRNAKERSSARLACVQALYHMEISEADANDVIEEFISYWFGKNAGETGRGKTDIAHFADVVRGVVVNQEEIDNLIDAALSDEWAFERLDKTLCALLRAAAYELTGRSDIPARVVIDEYLEIAHAFFEGKEPSFANGILDHVARDARAEEFPGEGGPDT